MCAVLLIDSWWQYCVRKHSIVQTKAMKKTTGAVKKDVWKYSNNQICMCFIRKEKHFRKSILCIPNANNIANTKNVTAIITANAIISATINDNYWDSTIIHN